LAVLITQPCCLFSKDGTYTVKYVYPKGGLYEVDIKFLGTFQGKPGRVRGSPFRITVLDTGDALINELDGPLMMENIRRKLKDTKEYSLTAIKSIKKTIPKDEVEALIKVKEVLKDAESKRIGLELSTDSNRAALQYFKSKGGQMDKMIEQLEHTATLWTDVVKQMPLTTISLLPLVKTWSGIIEEQLDAYSKEMRCKLKQFKACSFWDSDITPEQARASMAEAEKQLQAELEELAKKTGLCETFDFPHLVKAAKECVDEMVLDLHEMVKVWTVMDDLQSFVNQSKNVLWREMNIDVLDEGSKNQVKAVKSLHKCTRWSKAYVGADKLSKDFLNTIPLVSLLAAKSMRERHWEGLKAVTKKTFTPPCQDQEQLLGGILDLNLHEFTSDVEDICDQASKELKIENSIAGLSERWRSINWVMEQYKDTAVPLLRLSEEDFESLEADQLTVQGMLASRFVKQFEAEAQSWQKRLSNISDVFMYLGEIQRTWSYLEPLFIGSEEVKRELPEDARRFEGIDGNVKSELTTCWTMLNVEQSCNQVDLAKRLLSIQEQLEMCKKSLSDFLDGRRRQFPRYYFTSEADLLDILSNGSQPEKILKHTSKVYLACRTLLLDTERTPDDRPYATTWVSEVGVENVTFEPRVAMVGKVEIYQQTVLDAMKTALFNNLKRSVVRYSSMNRSEWLMHKKPAPNPKEDASDPAQIILLTLAVNYVQEVENVFKDYSEPSKAGQNHMRTYSELQVEQLKELIRLTQTKLNKSDRTRVMVCITMDAHARDIVLGMIRDSVQECSAFQWQSQLKHKYRKPPPTASFINRDLHLRGDGGERAEIAIADAIMPYDYEYLGNGPRLVITPLTDRIYVTATQALNLKMGCAPAGPAGTGEQRKQENSRMCTEKAT
jgi:dynein heavy chain, axonemal